MAETDYGRNADLAAERDAILALPPDQMQRALLAFSQRRSGVPEIPGGYRNAEFAADLPAPTGRFATNIVPETRMAAAKTADVSDGSGADPAAGGSGSSTTTPPAGGAGTTTPSATLSPALDSIFSRMTGRIESDIGLARQQGEIQQRQAGERATGARDAQRGLAAAERAAAEQFRSRPIPAFVPTQETAADIGTLFSLLAVAGQALGGKGKTGAMAAMAGMTGMLNGWRQGRQDLYQKERQNFEAGLRQIQAQNQALQEMYTRATRAAQTDMQGALAEAERRAIELGAPLAALAARRAGLQGFNTVDQSRLQVTSQLESRVQAARQAEEVRKRTADEALRTRIAQEGRTLEAQIAQEGRQRAEADRVRQAGVQAEATRNERELRERLAQEGRQREAQIQTERRQLEAQVQAEGRAVQTRRETESATAQRRNIENAGMRAQEIIDNQSPEQQERTRTVLGRAANTATISKNINDAYTIFESSEAAARQVAQYRDAVGPLGVALNRVAADPASGPIRSITNWFTGQPGDDVRGEAAMNQAIDRAVQQGAMAPDMAARAKVLSKTLFSLALADAQATGRPTVFLERALAGFYSQALRPETLLEIIHGRAEESTRRLPDPALRPNTRRDYNDNFSILSTMRDNRFDPNAFLERYPQVGAGNIQAGNANQPGRMQQQQNRAATHRYVPGTGVVPVE